MGVYTGRDYVTCGKVRKWGHSNLIAFFLITVCRGGGCRMPQHTTRGQRTNWFFRLARVPEMELGSLGLCADAQLLGVLPQSQLCPRMPPHVATLLGDSWLVHTGRMSRSSPTNAAGVSVEDWRACRWGLWRGLDTDLLESSGLQPPRTPWQGASSPSPATGFLPLSSLPSAPSMFPRMVTQIIHLHSNASLGSATSDNCYECSL